LQFKNYQVLSKPCCYFLDSNDISDVTI